MDKYKGRANDITTPKPSTVRLELKTIKIFLKNLFAQSLDNTSTVHSIVEKSLSGKMKFFFDAFKKILVFGETE